MSTTPRLVRVSLYVLVAAVAIQVADPFLGLAKGELLTRMIEDWLYNGVLIGAALVCVARAVRVREERLAWSLIGFGMVAWSAADLYYTLVLSKLDAPPYPSISDAGWLVFYPACWAAVVLLMRRRIREFHGSLWLDGIVAALGVAALTAALVLPPILAMSVEGEPSAVITNLSYPVGDVLLLVLMVGALALTGWRPDRPLALVGVGLVLSGAADIVYLSAVADGHKGGALPVPVEVIEQRTVGATLGDAAIDASVEAGIIGIALGRTLHRRCVPAHGAHGDGRPWPHTG